MTPRQSEVYNWMITRKLKGGVTCRDTARFLWPNHPLWKKRVGRWISLPGSSVLMMKAGSMLRRMQHKDLVYHQNNRWYPQ